jgi:hypothetical protein
MIFLRVVWSLVVNLKNALGQFQPNRRAQQKLPACGQFADATRDFLRGQFPKNWNRFRDSVSDNFRVSNPKAFRADVNGSRGSSRRRCAASVR